MTASVRRPGSALSALVLGLVGPLLLAAASATSAGPASGELDPSYGVGGVARLALDGDRTGWQALTLAGRKVVVAGTTVTPNQTLDSVVARYGPAGRLDRTFGRRGTVRVHVARSMTELLDIVRMPDGRLVAVGSVTSKGSGASAMLVMRFRPDGRVDRAFGTHGVVRIRFGDRLGYASGVVALPHGKVAVAGYARDHSGETSAMVVLRLTRSGSLDPTFHGTGRLVLNTPGQTAESLLALAKAPDGRLVAVGNGDGVVVLRLTSDGEPDPGFATDGVALLDLGEEEMATDVTVLPDDSIVVAGHHNDVSGKWVGMLARVTPAGELDTGFAGGDGYLDIPVPRSDTTLLDVTKGASGQLVLVGESVPRGPQGTWQSLVVRTDAAGAPDASFGADGVAVTTLGARFSALREARVARDGRILAAGFAGNRHHTSGAVARFVG
ncbi:MAG: hypothetical protein KDB63_14250 [Nocardioidaceae bacterium]|nr:hypothetical protein [Nocardioidaceae bacterium]